MAAPLVNDRKNVPPMTSELPPYTVLKLLVRIDVWFVDLGALRDGAMVPTALAQALGVQERAGKPLINALCAHLRPLQALLILDNCEHLLAACANLVDTLLKAAAQTTIITTSREPIRISGEQVYPLPPLSVPEPDASVAALQRSEAVQLLVARLRQQLPDFELTADRAPAVVELCIRLDGIPLALELAAARARSLSIEQINAQLGNRFRVLTSGSRGALPRQQTLRATLDWSYDLLGEDERVVLRRLAVFAGSFTLDAACAVTSDADIDAFAVIDLLSQLVARSLVIADMPAKGTRYRLLETTRAYAQEKLDEAGEADVMARKLAEHLCEAFANAPQHYLQLPDAKWREIYPSADIPSASRGTRLVVHGEWRRGRRYPPRRRFEPIVGSVGTFHRRRTPGRNGVGSRTGAYARGRPGAALASTRKARRRNARSGTTGVRTSR